MRRNLLSSLFVAVLMVVSFQCTKSMPHETVASGVLGVDLTSRRVPMFIGKPDNVLYDLKVRSQITDSSEPVFLRKISIRFTSSSQPGCLAAVSVTVKNLQNQLFGSIQNPGATADITGNGLLVNGLNFFTLNFTVKTGAQLSQAFEIGEVELTFSDQKTMTVVPQEKFVNRPTLVLRAAGQDQVDTYRIPGLVTTTKGTMVAVYDNRYLNSADLQGDIDVGMSRSTDGGQTWAPMKRIIDMGTYNNLPQVQNGVGDPSVLVDQATNTIWVAGLWVSGIPGQTAWNGSKPGMNPGTTGQFVLVKSEDDGVTWSQPVSITQQCKVPEWNLFFQGPGKGITMSDGTLVFPAQYKDSQAVPWSTIVWSKDHGKTWSVGTGAKSNTTEAQVIQLTDGSLMLNMRDDRNRTEKGPMNGRAVSVTKDLGQTWTVHSSSNSALPESNCQGSLISAKVMVKGALKDVLFFSNPNDKYSRAHMTIRASLDQGVTWPAEYQVELNSEDSYGYSCLTMVNDSLLGILYEGTKDLYFQEIQLQEIFK